MKLRLKLWKIKISIIAKEFFQYSLLTYFILLLVEMLKEGLISNFFNLNILLAVVFVSGLVMVLTHDEKIPLPSSPPKQKTYLNIGYSVLLALGGGFFVFAGTFDLGIVAVVVGLLAAFLIFLLSLLLLTDKE